MGQFLGHSESLITLMAMTFMTGGFSLSRATSYCLLPNTMNQTRAQQTCLSREMTLAQPKTMESWNIMANYVTSIEDGEQEGWLHIEYRNGEWIWGDGSVLNTDNWPIWRPGEPDRVSVETCARVVAGRLANLKCSHSRRPMCQYEESPMTRDANLDRLKKDSFPRSAVPLYDVITGSQLTCMLKCLDTPRCASYALTRGHGVTCSIFDSIEKQFDRKPGSDYFVRPCLV